MVLTNGTKLRPYEILSPLGLSARRRTTPRSPRLVARRYLDHVSADGRSAYVYHDEKTSAPVYRLDLTTGKRQPVATLGVNDPAGITAIGSVCLTPDGKSYAYSYNRELSDLFLVEGLR